MTVIIEPEADREWNEAVDHYEERDPGVGARFNFAIWERLKVLAAQPERFPLVGRVTRKAKIHGWPYAIYFAVNESMRQIKVIAVWHGKRNPKGLHRRIK
jgi:plasmid stabilization system protein ParE